MTGGNRVRPSGRGPRSLLARLRSVAGDVQATVPVDDADRPWLALGLLPGVVAVAIYLATNPYPAYGAGLYAKISSEIVATGY